MEILWKKKMTNNLDEEIQNLVDNEESQVHHSNEIDIENNNSNSESEILK